MTPFLRSISADTFPNEPIGAIALNRWAFDLGNVVAQGLGNETPTQPYWFVDAANGSTVADATAPVNISTVGAVRFTDATTDCASGGGNTVVKLQSTDIFVPPATVAVTYLSFWFKLTGLNPAIYVNGLKFFNLFNDTGVNGGTSILEIYPSNVVTGAGPYFLGWVFQISGVTSTGTLGSTAATLVAETWYQVEVTVNHATKQHTTYLDGTQASQTTNPLAQGLPNAFEWGWVYGGGPCQGSGQDWSMYHDDFYMSYTA